MGVRKQDKFIVGSYPRLYDTICEAASASAYSNTESLDKIYVLQIIDYMQE